MITVAMCVCTYTCVHTRLCQEVNEIYPAGEHRCVCVHGAQSSVLLPHSEGCEDAFLTESCLTLSFTHTVKCWSLQRNGEALVWSGETNTTERTGKEIRSSAV